MKKMVFFTETQLEEEYVITSINIKGNPDFIKLPHRNYKIDFSKPTYVNSKGVRIYIVNIITGAQLEISGKPANVSPQDLDAIIGTKIVKEITSAVAENTKDKIIHFIIGAIIGALVGVLIAFLVMQSKIDAANAQQSTQTITTGIKMIRCLLW